MSYPWHLYLMAATYMFAGSMHFIRPKMYMRILPGYLPGHKLLVTFSGLAEIFLGLALCFAATKDVAIYLIIAMLTFFLPVHFHMLFDKKASMGLPKWMLIWRIPLQFLLMFWAYWYLRF
ncbi:MAG: DoxX family protein [Aurantibacter sp.]